MAANLQYKSSMKMKKTWRLLNRNDTFILQSKQKVWLWSYCYYYNKLPEIQVFLTLVDAKPVELWTRIHSAKRTNIMISTVNMSV